MWNANSGGNTASFNLGNVFIQTGSIQSIIGIVNNVNANTAVVTCCPEKHEPPVVPPVTPPGPGGTSTSNGGSSSGSTGAASGSSNSSTGPSGQILPATGDLSFLGIFLLATMFLIFGLYLRLRAGNSPNMA
jgi:hypothetical protein